MGPPTRLFTWRLPFALSQGPLSTCLPEEVGLPRRWVFHGGEGATPQLMRRPLYDESEEKFPRSPSSLSQFHLFIFNASSRALCSVYHSHKRLLKSTIPSSNSQQYYHEDHYRASRRCRSWAGSDVLGSTCVRCTPPPQFQFALGETQTDSAPPRPAV